MKWSELLPESAGGLVIRPGSKAEVLIAPGTPEHPPFEEVEGRWGKRYRVHVWLIVNGQIDLRTYWFCGKRALSQILTLADNMDNIIPPKPIEKHQSVIITRIGEGTQTQYVIVPSNRYYKTPTESERR